METPETIQTPLHAGEWVTSIDFKDAYFHIPIHRQSRKYMRFHLQGRSYQFKALPFGLSTAPMEFTVVVKEAKFLALQKGIRIHQYLDDWLVRARSHQTCLQHTQTLVALCQEQSQTQPRALADPTNKNKRPPDWSGVPGLEANVPHRSPDSNRETSTLRPVTHETHTVASQKQLEHTRVTRKGDPHSQVTPPTFKMVAGGRQSTHRSTITPTKICSANLYRCIKRRVGHSLKKAHGKGRVVPSRKQTTRKLPGTKGGLSGPKRIPESLFKQHGPHNYRQHNSSCLHKQGGRDEVGPLMCPHVENPDLVFQKTGYCQSLTHPQLAECDSRQTIQTEPNHSNRVVPPPRDLPSNMLPLEPAPGGSVCH